MSQSPVGEANVGAGSVERRRGAMRSLIEATCFCLYSIVSIREQHCRHQPYTLNHGLSRRVVESYVLFGSVGSRLPARSTPLARKIGLINIKCVFVNF